MQGRSAPNADGILRRRGAQPISHRRDDEEHAKDRADAHERALGDLRATEARPQVEPFPRRAPKYGLGGCQNGGDPFADKHCRQMGIGARHGGNDRRVSHVTTVEGQARIVKLLEGSEAISRSPWA